MSHSEVAEQARVTGTPPQEWAVSVRQVSKRYRLYAQPQDRLKQALLWRFGLNFGHEFWALREISFEIGRGEVVGIIGRNGAGKSTLLQILAGTLAATTGTSHLRGRVTAVLELGSGFNPEYTGRENVYFGAALLGFSRAEVAQRFSEIAAFADIGEFMDQPVKIYSTGMLMRLAFTLQVLFDPEVLIVDEALAVGDAAFQLKCFDRMKRLSDAGITILLVTHDVQTVRSVCTRAIWLNEGRLAADGPPGEVTAQYVRHLFGDPILLTEQTGEMSKPAATSMVGEDSSAASLGATRPGAEPETPLGTPRVHWGSGEIQFVTFVINEVTPSAPIVWDYGERIRLCLRAQIIKSPGSQAVGFGFSLRNTRGLDIVTCTTYDQGLRYPDLMTGQTVDITFAFDNLLAPGDYALVAAAEERSEISPQYFDFVENLLMIKVVAHQRIFSLVLPQIEITSSVTEPNRDQVNPAGQSDGPGEAGRN